MIVGLLPASGSATRVGGIPKFVLPISDNETLIQWHIKNMSEVCDQIRISTRSLWLPILHNMNLNCEIFELEPSTMSDAIVHMYSNDIEKVLIGMPDTFISDTDNNFYENILNSNTDICLASWPCSDDLFGRVGQINYDKEKVIEVIDKDPTCKFDRMWGAMCFNLDLNYLDRSLAHPGLQINEFIKNGYSVSHKFCDGKYIDAGKFSGIKELYNSL